MNSIGGPLAHNRRVLLINPPYITSASTAQIDPPSGLVYIATVLSKNSFEPRILDATLPGKERLANGLYRYGLRNDAIVEYARKFQPHVIGLGCLFSSKWKALISIADELKKALPGTFIVAGGIYPSMEPQKSIEKSSSIDFCIKGEAEYSFLELCECLSVCRSRENIDEEAFNRILDIDGIVLRRSGVIHMKPKNNYITNLDDLPLPDYDLIAGGLEQYFSRRPVQENFRLSRRHLSVLTSRSCPNRCTFCNMRLVHGDKIRYRSPRHVLSEIKHLHHKYQVSHFVFDDDNVSLNRGRFKELCQGMIDLGFEVRWASQNGMMINTIDDEVVSLMARSGCRWVALAVESGNPELRSKVVRKPIRNEKIEEVFRSLKRSKIFTQMFLIVGFYEDSDTSIEDSRKLMWRVRPDLVSAHVLTLYPQTELFDKYRSSGLIKGEYDISGSVDELFHSNYELYEGYSSNVDRWCKIINTNFYGMLLSRPYNLVKYADYYFPAILGRFPNILRNLFR